MGLLLHVQVYRDGQPVGEHIFDSDKQRNIKIGRLKSAQLKLDDPSVSRIHAVIELAASGPSLIDMGSGSTTVNGNKVHKAKLNHGDTVVLGATTLMIGVGAPAQASAAPAAQAMPTPGVAPAGAPGQPMPGQPMPGQPMPGQPMAGQPMAGQPMPGQPMPSPGLPPAGVAPQVAPPPMVAQPPQAGAPPPQAGAPPQQPPQAAGAAQPRFDGGGQQAGMPGRATHARAFGSAVESRPHPSLPPEPKLSNDNRVLEMRAYWGDVLLSVHHYKDTKVITLGEAKGTDFFISSEGLPVEVFPFVRHQDGDYVLTFTKYMEGEMEIDRQLQPLHALRGSSKAKKDPDLEDSYNISLGTESRALVHWGGATFALRFVPPAKPPVNSFFEGMDLQYVNLLVVSFLFHIAFLATMMWYPYDTDALRVDLFDDDAGRFADIVLHGPKENKSTEDLLDRLKKQVEEKKKEIEKKPEIKPDKTLQTKVKVVKRQPTQAERSQAVKQKFSKLFNSGAGSGSGSLLGGGGGGTLSGTLSNVIGTTGAGSASAALAGLGIRGTGPLTGGGIGTSRGIAGIGTSGRAGGGGLAYGSGIGIGKKKSRGMISLSTPVVMGALPREAIQKVINQNKAQIRYCYEVQLQRNPDLEGRIMMTWIIAATGSVAKVKVQNSSMKNPAVERCIAAKIKTWKFPAPSGGGIVEVNYPFVFRAS